jgi:FlaA1/EpsC-like NDP-sugar epimerase
MHKILEYFWKYNLPRWSILIIDLIICAFSLTLAFFLRFNFKQIPPEDLKNLPYDYILLFGIRSVSFFISKTYKGVVRYTGSNDAMRIFKVVVLGSGLLVVVNVITLYTLGYFIIPHTVIIIDALVTMFIND